MYKSVLVNWEMIAMQGPARVLIVGKDATNDKKLAETLNKDGFECAIGDIAHTEFAVEGHHAPVKVMLTTTLAGFQHGDTAESLIGRTRNVDLRVAA